jgi:hypothetical protein
MLGHIERAARRIEIDAIGVADLAGHFGHHTHGAEVIDAAGRRRQQIENTRIGK